MERRQKQIERTLWSYVHILLSWFWCYLPQINLEKSHKCIAYQIKRKWDFFVNPYNGNQIQFFNLIFRYIYQISFSSFFSLYLIEIKLGKQKNWCWCKRFDAENPRKRKKKMLSFWEFFFFQISFKQTTSFWLIKIRIQFFFLNDTSGNDNGLTNGIKVKICIS